MEIVSAHEGPIPISSSMSNAFIDFSTMDCSIVALVSDVEELSLVRRGRQWLGAVMGRRDAPCLEPGREVPGG